MLFHTTSAKQDEEEEEEASLEEHMRAPICSRPVLLCGVFVYTIIHFPIPYAYIPCISQVEIFKLSLHLLASSSDVGIFCWLPPFTHSKTKKFDRFFLPYRNKYKCIRFRPFLLNIILFFFYLLWQYLNLYKILKYQYLNSQNDFFFLCFLFSLSLSHTCIVFIF